MYSQLVDASNSGVNLEASLEDALRFKYTNCRNMCGEWVYGTSPLLCQLSKLVLNLMVQCVELLLDGLFAL